MKRAKSKKKLIIGIVAGVVVLVSAILVLVQVLNQKADPYKQPETINQAPDSAEDTPPTQDAPDTTETPPVDDTPTPSALDPATVSTIDIAPLGITVAYVKGIGGFEYEVQRTAEGTRYVQLTSPQLVGTKCTNDNGLIASIVVDPSVNDVETIAKRVTVDGTVYGYAPAGANCTGDPDLLKQYQASFSDAFSLLKKTATN